MNKEHSADKKYYEKKAQLTLMQKFNNIYSIIIIDDKPDLIDTKNHYGIEVTRAFYDNYGEINGLSEKCINKSIDDIPPELLKKIKKLGAHPIEIKNVCYGVAYPARWCSNDCIEKCFLNKIKKLNEGKYSKMKFYDLYIFSQGFDEFEFCDIEKILIKISQMQEKSTYKFRYVFIDDETSIYQCDLITNSLLQQKIEKKELHKINVEAKNYAMNK